MKTKILKDKSTERLSVCDGLLRVMIQSFEDITENNFMT